MKNQPIHHPRTADPVLKGRPGFISATELRARLPSILEQLEASAGTLVVYRYNKPAAILRGGLDPDGQPVIHFIPVQSSQGQQILTAARRTA